MGVLDTVKTKLLRDPRRSRIDWIPVVFGSFIITLTLGGILVGADQGAPFRLDAEFGILGLAFVCMGGAELLSVDRRGSVALLRGIAIALFISFLVAFIMIF